jgi:NAD(P) transhydrogenase
MLYLLLKTSLTTSPLQPLTQLSKQKLISTSNLNLLLNRWSHKDSKPAPKGEPVLKPGSIAYKNLTIGVPKEMWTKERRVALTPIAVQTLIKKGISVRIESNAGSEAKFLDSDYESVGAKIVDRKAIFESDVILKVRQPLDEELALFRNNSTLISFLYPAQNQKLIDQLSTKQLNVFAMDCIPRISRAQVFDALSSMANIAGYL